MPPSNQDGYTEAREVTRQLQQLYADAMKELKAVAENTAREEVGRIAADNEDRLQRLIGDAVARHGGGGFRLQATHVLGVVAALLVLWLVFPFVARTFSGLGFGRPSTVAEVEERDGTEEEPADLSPIERGPLPQVAKDRYDSLFARHDAAIQRLIVDAQGAATLDSTVARALARWTADSVTVTNDDRDIVHAAAFQASMRKLTGGEIDSPVNGKVNREDCDQDEYCRTLVARWRIDRSTGMRLLPPIPDRRDPNANELEPVEKLVIYSQLSP